MFSQAAVQFESKVSAVCVRMFFVPQELSDEGVAQSASLFCARELATPVSVVAAQ